MKFGHFDDSRKEYVITSPDTPKSWSNYLGDTQYGALITNNAGGYSFYKSGGMGRFMRMRFNSVPMDQPGRYLYLFDKKSRDFWSGSWQPVGKPLDQFKSVCRHGMGYTIITSLYNNIETETTYFVPQGKTLELWSVKVTNKGSENRSLKAYTYVEYAASWNALDDLMNIQYVQYTASMKVIDGIIDHGTNVNIPAMPDNFKEKDQGRHTFQAIAGLEITGFDTDREAFLGPYRTYANPIAVSSGTQNQSIGYGDNPCGSLSGDLELKPGETKEFVVILGIGKADTEGVSARAEFCGSAKINQELEKIKSFWHTKTEGFIAQTPDSELNSTINVWGIYNALVTFNWSRAASLIYSGIDRDGLGYRDSVQDLVGVVHAIPREVKTRLELMITGQTSEGGAMPCVYPISHKPGNEPLPDKSEYRSDDCMWLFNAIPAYIKETGDIEFLHQTLPYSDKGHDSVLGHMRRAIEFSLRLSGKHGFPCGLRADWNDCLKFGYDGESIFVGMQLRLALKEYLEAAALINKNSESEWAATELKKLDHKLEKDAWDGEWYMRGYRADGMKFGSKESEEGQIFLNPQVWAVISGLATGERAQKILDKVNERLATPYGLVLCDPPYTHSDYNIVRAQLMNPGLKENGGIFVHTQGWGVMAEAMVGNGTRAYQYLRAYLPAAYNDKAEIREIEPYVVCQSTHTKYSPKHGASRIPWLSGSATWTYYAITRYILGFQPGYECLTLDPCIPENWNNISFTRKFRGFAVHVTIINEKSVEKGVSYIIVNGKNIPGNQIPYSALTRDLNIEVIME
jgi:cellobiose phosphorylase